MSSRTQHVDYYDDEAERYDDSRGGPQRARSAADAVLVLAGPPGLHLDVGGGTGSVAAHLAAAGFSSVVSDVSTGMLRVAARRLPRRQVRADAQRLPFTDGSFALVTEIWLLHLLEEAEAEHALAEMARLVEPGVRAVVSVDKLPSHGMPPTVQDDAAVVASRMAAAGLVPCGRSSFTATSPWGSATHGDPEFVLLGFERPA